ncbi:MAG TPA: hypothetical protein PLU99_06140 [Phycisphaerae bacterium]|nr:hypothetical protein [Phycisphaerae bacterium]HRS28503.1 hypothetical protein [Phycisphaerae bacterium]
MSALDDQMSLYGAPLLRDTLGRGVTYHAADGSAVPLAAAVVGPERAIEATSQQGERRVEYERSVTIDTDPALLTGGVADPAINAQVEVEGVRYAIAAVTRLAGGRALLRCMRRAAAEAARRGYRGK